MSVCCYSSVQSEFFQSSSSAGVKRGNCYLGEIQAPIQAVRSGFNSFLSSPLPSSPEIASKTQGNCLNYFWLNADPWAPALSWRNRVLQVQVRQQATPLRLTNFSCFPLLKHLCPRKSVWPLGTLVLSWKDREEHHVLAFGGSLFYSSVWLFCFE